MWIQSLNSRIHEVLFSLKNKDLNKQCVFKYKGNELVLNRLVDHVD